jgi:hypothetical protein
LVLGLSLIITLLAGCGSNSDLAPNDGPENPPRVEGTVFALQEPLATASQNSLTPLAQTEVRLFRVSSSGDIIEPALQSTATDARGGYAFEKLPAQGLLMLRTSANAGSLRAYVSSDHVDITPASELSVRRVTESLSVSMPLSEFSRPELAALTAYLSALPLAPASDLDQTLEALNDSAGVLFTNLLTSYGEGEIETLAGGSYGAVEFSSTLRDFTMLAGEGIAGGIDSASGIGVITFTETDAQASTGFMARALYLQEPDGTVQINATQDLSLHEDLGGLLHVPALNGQMLVVDTKHLAEEEAVLGAVLASGGLMIYPLSAAVESDGVLAAFSAGLRIATRWAAPADSIPGNASLDGLGGKPSDYHLVAMSELFAGSDEPALTITSGSGILRFDNSPRTLIVPGSSEAQDFGSFLTGAGRSAMTLARSDDAVSEKDPGSVLPVAGLYQVIPGTGLLELRTNEGFQFGSGVFSGDGEIVAVATSATSDNGALAERSLGVAIRHTDDTDAVPTLDGAYNLLEYTIHIAASDDAASSAAFVIEVLRRGVVQLDGEGGAITEATLSDRESRLAMSSSQAGNQAGIARAVMAETLALPGTFSVDGSGAVKLELSLRRDDDEQMETLSGAGAASRNGDFIALAVRSAGRDPGRGLLFLMRQRGS